MNSSFHRANRAGQAGERRLAMRYGGEVMPPRSPHDVAIEAGRLPPWLVPALPVGAPLLTVEVKCDSYPPASTPYMFIERCTVRPDGTRIIGGPWRAAADGVLAFAYLFSENGLVLWAWNLPRLCTKLTAEGKGNDAWPARTVRNGKRGYRALGRLVPRAEFAALASPYYHEEYI